MMHYVSNPNKAIAFDLTQPITQSMLTNGVFDLHGSWLQFGDLTGNGEIGFADLLLLQQHLGGHTMSMNIIRETADMNASGSGDITPTDLLLLQLFIANFPVILGIPAP